MVPGGVPKWGGYQFTVTPAHSVTVQRGAASEYRIWVSIIISSYGTATLIIKKINISATSKIHYCIGSLNVGVAPRVQYFSAFHYNYNLHGRFF